MADIVLYSPDAVYEATAGERASPYQGFNDGTVYPGKRGENYISEGFLLRALKSTRYPYTDATNVIGYYVKDVESPQDDDFPPNMTAGSVVIDPATARHVLRTGIAGTIWIYRYYDLAPRSMEQRRDAAATQRLHAGHPRPFALGHASPPAAATR